MWGKAKVSIFMLWCRIKKLEYKIENILINCVTWNSAELYGKVRNVIFLKLFSQTDSELVSKR